MRLFVRGTTSDHLPRSEKDHYRNQCGYLSGVRRRTIYRVEKAPSNKPRIACEARTHETRECGIP